MTKLSRRLWFAFGILNLIIGITGTILPILPGFPFLFLTLISFSKSSEKFHRWFVGSKIYRDNLMMYVEHRAMTWRVKIRVMITVTLFMGFGFFMVLRKGLYIANAIIAAVWIVHIVCFCCIIQTITEARWQEILSNSNADQSNNSDANNNTTEER